LEKTSHRSDQGNTDGTTVIKKVWEEKSIMAHIGRDHHTSVRKMGGVWGWGVVATGPRTKKNHVRDDDLPGWCELGQSNMLLETPPGSESPGVKRGMV